MIRSNIQGLGKLLNKFNDRIDKLERKNFEVVGGENIRVTTSGMTKIINGDPAGDSAPQESSGITCPWRVSAEILTLSSGKKYKLKTDAGTINGLIPENYDDIITLDEDEEKYLYYEAVTSQGTIGSLRIKASDDVPDTQTPFTEGYLPTTIKGLVAYWKDNKVQYSWMCNNIVLSPDLAYTLDDPQNFGNKLNYYTWVETNPNA